MTSWGAHTTRRSSLTLLRSIKSSSRSRTSFRGAMKHCWNRHLRIGSLRSYAWSWVETRLIVWSKESRLMASSIYRQLMLLWRAIYNHQSSSVTQSSLSNWLRKKKVVLTSLICTDMKRWNLNSMHQEVLLTKDDRLGSVKWQLKKQTWLGYQW